MHTVLEIIQKSADFLGSKGVEQPRLQAELIVGHALGLKRMQLYLQFERLLTDAELALIRPLIKRRSQREPLQYILGDTEFAGLKLKVDRRALIPRPETEYLVELIQTRLTSTPKSVLDLGTGSGALALALARAYPEAQVTGTDRSEDALALARENAAGNGLGDRVAFVSASWFSGIPADATFDLIVSNPPYLTADETAQAAPEVRDFEPHAALTAKEDGLSDLVEIIAGAHAHLSAGGLLALETGIAQHERLASAFVGAGLVAFESVRDLTGRDRYVFGRREG